MLSVILIMSSIIVTDKILIKNIFDEMYYCAMGNWNWKVAVVGNIFIGGYRGLVVSEQRDSTYDEYQGKYFDATIEKEIVKQYTNKEGKISIEASCDKFDEDKTFNYHYKKNYISIGYSSDITLVLSYDFDTKTVYYQSATGKESEELRRQVNDFLCNVIAKMWSDNNPKSRFSPGNLGRFKMVEGEMPKA